MVLAVCAGARNVYHQLLMNSLLMDRKFKKLFAIRFAKVTGPDWTGWTGPDRRDWTGPDRTRWTGQT